jgi:hypothetical protein
MTRTYLKKGIPYFLVIPGLNRNPVTFPFIIKNKEFRITKLQYSSRWIPAGVYPVLDTGPV